MGLCAWLIENLLPHRSPPADLEQLDAAFLAVTHARQQTADDAQRAVASVERHRRAVEAERTRIQARTEVTAQKRHVGQTTGARAAVQDMLDSVDRRHALSSNGNPDS